MLCSCQQYHGKRQAFGRRDGEPHALRKDEHGHQDECRNEEHQAAKEHIDRGAGVLLYGLIVTDDGDVRRLQSHHAAAITAAPSRNRRD